VSESLLNPKAGKTLPRLRLRVNPRAGRDADIPQSCLGAIIPDNAKRLRAVLSTAFALRRTWPAIVVEKRRATGAPRPVPTSAPERRRPPAGRQVLIAREQILRFCLPGTRTSPLQPTWRRLLLP